MRTNALRDEACARVEKLADTLLSVSHRVHANPELGFGERKAAALLSGVAAHGLAVKRGICGLPTAFRADAGGARGRRVVICCEYDALPELGHACGHNVIAAAGLGAGLALAGLAERFGWPLTLLGTPAEEGGGGKVILLRRGAFNGAAAVLLVHPATVDDVLPPIRAVARMVVDYHGRAAHSALGPHLGRNALDALLLAFQAVHTLGGALPPGDQLHGTIVKGGTSPSIVPSATRARFLGRSNTAAGLAALIRRALECFEAGGRAVGCHATVRLDGPVYRELHPSLPLATSFHRHLRHLGREPRPLALPPPGALGGGSDLGNVSIQAPAIHPMLAIAPPGTPPHTPGFARCAVQPRADQAVLDGAKAMAMTAIDVWTAHPNQSPHDPSATSRNQSLPREETTS